MAETRKESDSLGSMEIPKDLPWGIYTQRVLGVYPQDGISLVPEIFLRHYIQAKMVYASVNARFGKIDKKVKKIIHAVGTSLLDLDSADFMLYFPVSQIQSGGGTSTNMLVNEVMANLANKALGDEFGGDTISAHDHLNASQSSNDTFPGVTKLATVELLSGLVHELELLMKTFKKKGREWKKIKKVGRTHLQDAVVISLGDEMSAYARSIQKNISYIQQSIKGLSELNFGGTATGSLQNITPEIRKALIKEFAKVYKTSFVQAKSYFEQNSSSADFAHGSQSLVLLANTFIKISADLRLLSSGPLAGFDEIDLPAVQPGSSIMPGKVNPSVLEALTMVSAKIIGTDQSIQVLTRQAQLELQQFMPGIAFPLLESIQWMMSSVTMLRESCIEGIQPNYERISELLEGSFAYATDYSEKLGYEKVAALVKKALKEKSNLRELLEEALRKLG